MKYSGDNDYRPFGQDISDTALTSCKWTDDTPTHIAFGYGHALYLVNQSVFVAGRNDHGQCGIDNNKQRITNITKLTFHHPIKAVFSNHASYHSFILTTNNELYAFGYNTNGQLGVRGNNNTDITIPTKSDIGMNIKCIATGYDYSIALSIDGDVLSTEYNEYGGNGHKTTQKTAWTKISGFKVQIAQIAVGYGHSLFRDKEGVVLCCGRNYYGQLGIGIKDNDKHCSPFVIDALKTNVIDIAAGFNHSICLLENGAVYTFGSNEYGQCGHDEELECILSPTKVKGLNDIMKVKAGGFHTAAIKTNGITEIYMFGSNGNGECIAERDKTKIYAPVGISAVVKNETGKYVNDIHLGYDCSCVITVEEMKETKEETQSKYDRNLEDEIMSLKRKINEDEKAHQIEIERVQNESERQLSEIKDSNRKYEADLERVKNETETQKAQMVALRKEIDERNKEVMQIKDELEHGNAVNDGLKDKMDEMKRNNENLKKENASLKNERERQKIDYGKQIHSMESEYEAIKTLNDELEHGNTSKSKQLEEMKQLNESLNDKVNACSAQNTSLGEDIASLKRMKTEDENAHKLEIQRMQNEIERQLSEMKDKNRRLNEENQQYENEMNSLQRDKQQLCDENNNEREMQKTQMVQLQQEIEERRTEVIQVKGVLESERALKKKESEEHNALSDGLKEDNKRLEEDNAEKIRNLETDKQSLTDTNSGLKNGNKEKTSENERLKKENDSLKNTVSSLEDERKEYDMEINELKQENKRLKLENINTDDCENWSAEQIVYWIVSLDADIYGEYEEILMKTLKEEEVNGECLSDVDINISDIKRWGIKSLKKSKRLLKEIKSLLHNKGKKKRIPELNEGANPPTAYM